MEGYEIKTIVEDVLWWCENNKKDFEHCAINWGSLSVVSVERITELWPDHYESIRVTIDEASPEAYMFRKAITNICKLKHGIDIEVVTEW